MIELGHRQRRLLIEIAVQGRGRWPQGWQLRSQDAITLARLHRRELVTSAGTDARLTSAGHLIACSLRGVLP